MGPVCRLYQELGRRSGCANVSVNIYQRVMRRGGVGFEIRSLQCILVAATEPEVALFSHVLSQIQGGKV